MRPLAHIEPNCGLPLPGLGRIDECNGVFQLKTAQAFGHQRRGKYFELKKPAGIVARILLISQLSLLLPLKDGPGGARIDRSCLCAFYVEFQRYLGVVLYFDQHRSETILVKHGCARTARYFHTQLRINAYNKKNLRIERLLKRGSVPLLRCFQDLAFRFLGQRLKENYQGLEQSLCIRAERLAFRFSSFRSTAGHKADCHKKGNGRD